MAKVYVIQMPDGYYDWLQTDAGAFLDHDEAERAAKAISLHAEVVELELHGRDVMSPEWRLKVGSRAVHVGDAPEPVFELPKP